MENNKKILIITYYWPPAGGIAVKRWLALSGELADLDCEVHVLTLDEAAAEYNSIDRGLQDAVHPGVHVHKVTAWNPFRLTKRLFRRHIPKTGFSAPENGSSKANLLTILRSNLFIPDPRRTWNSNAIRRAIEIIDSEQIETIITTSPPHSTQLIGLHIVKKRSVKWVADFRDPWTDIFYYSRLGHSKVSARIDAFFERKVLSRADAIVTVTWGFAKLLQSKSSRRDEDVFHVIPNGIDGEISKPEPPQEATKRRIVYTGILGDSYFIESFLEAVDQLNSQMKDPFIFCDFYGSVPSKLEDALSKRFSFVCFHGTIPMQEIRAIQESADALFLTGPIGFDTIIPGKLFEYLSVSKPVLYLGSPDLDVERILRETKTGFVLDRLKPESFEAVIQDALQISSENKVFSPDLKALSRYFRSSQAKMILDVIRAAQSNQG